MNLQINQSKLFIASCISLVTTGMAFSLRAGMVGTWATAYNLTLEQVGWINGTAFYGFTLAMLFGGPLCDIIGMKRIIYIAAIGHVIGIILTIVSTSFWPLYISTLFIGVANGMVEAACNPLVTALFSTEKTKMLNRFHVWFPGGLVIGGLIGYFLGNAGISWQIQMATMLVPAVIYAVMFFPEKLPVTERVASGVSTGDMFKACANDLFVFMVFCMLITASTELGTNQLIGKFLENTGVSPILVLVYISGLMMIGRSFAGNFVHAVSPAGILWLSALLSTIGLIWLSYATGISTFAAATVFAVGICFFWPTMLGFVAEYLPNTGALGLSIMGGAGMLSVSFVLPVLGKLLDNQTGEQTLRYFAFLPAFLILAFAGLYFYTRKYSQVKPSHQNDI